MNLKYIPILALIVSLVQYSTALGFRGKNSTPQNRTEKEYIIYSQKNTTEFTVKHKGHILVTDNDKDILSISPNGYLTIEQSSFGNVRKLELKANAQGVLTKKYFEGKTEKDYKEAGSEWFESLMPNLIYQTVIGGKERIIRIYNQHGIKTALEEAEKLRKREGTGTGIIVMYYRHETNYPISNHNLYYKAIIDNIELNEQELQSFLKSLSKMRSNGNKGSILRQVVEKYKLTPSLMEDFLETASTLDYNTERGNTLRAFVTKYDIDDSNYKDFFRVINGMTINSEKGNVMKPILDKQVLSDKIFIAFLECVQNFTNNSEKAAVLRRAIHKLPDNQEVIDAFTTCVNSMSSPYRYLKEELNNLLLNRNYFQENNNISKNLMLSTLKSARSKKANTIKSTTLRKLHASLTNDSEIIEAYFAVIESMDNTVETYNLLLEYLRSIKVNKLGYIALFVAAEDIAKNNNKHAASAIIRAAIPSMPNDKDVTDQLFDAIEDIDHNSGREEIIRLLTLHKKANNNADILKMLNIASEIDIDIEKALALNYISKTIPKKNEDAMFLFKRIANELEIEYEYNRAISKQ